MNDPVHHRYAAPAAEVADVGTAAGPGPQARLPVALVARWLLAALLLVLGLRRLAALAANWRVYIDRMIIDPTYSPYPWLAVELCLLATGVLLAWRSRWVFVPLLLHAVLFARQVPASGPGRLPAEVHGIWAAELLVFGCCAWLWLRRGLK